MALKAVGLKTAIWNNNFMSLFLLAWFPFLILAMVFAFFAFSGFYSEMAPRHDPVDAGIRGMQEYLPTVLGVVTVWFLIAFFFHSSIVNAATGSHSVTRHQEPRIYNILENLCISRGLTMPKLQVIETGALNAFASGISKKSFQITLTRGIMDALEDDELEAVMAHELTHIRNRDVRLLIVSIVFVGIISFACQMIWRGMGRGMMSGRGNRKGGGAMILIAGVILGIGYFFAILVRFALSRKREFMADAGAVELTKNPTAMISALNKISGNAALPNVSSDMREMMIENPRMGFMDMFATHPPIEKRIEVLKSFGGVDEMELSDARKLWK